ncbi:hypothetical protein HZB01_02155 [Candidatus Woesearchaeota archaeon]|nr:hypothetical protein [Candidatus Woesearchaeota archaeon]
MKRIAIIASLLLLALVVSGCTSFPKGCTLEAKICPDGSGVGRNSSNNCEFDPCPAGDTGVDNVFGGNGGGDAVVPPPLPEN